MVEPVVATPNKTEIYGTWKLKHEIYNYYVKTMNFQGDTVITFEPKNGIVFGDKGIYTYSRYYIEGDQLSIFDQKIIVRGDTDSVYYHPLDHHHTFEIKENLTIDGQIWVR